MVVKVKFSEWLGADLPPLPSNQLIPDDDMIVIRGGLPYAYDPITRAAYSEMGANASATTINTLGDWESIAGTLVASGLEEGFTLASNIWTVIAEDSIGPVQVEAGITAMKVGSGDDTYEVAIFKNGTIRGVGMSLNTHMTKLSNAFVKTPLFLDAGDTIEIKVRNLDDTANVTITDMFFGIG
jgi:hypothetical protein